MSCRTRLDAPLRYPISRRDLIIVMLAIRQVRIFTNLPCLGMCFDLFVVTVSFLLVDDPTTSLLAWTTTPWTLPSNLALCVHPDFDYIKIHDETRNENFILFEGLLTTLYKDPKKAKFKKIGTFKGSEMKDWRYQPLFDYFTDKVSAQSLSLFDVHGRSDSFITDSMKTVPTASSMIRMSRRRAGRELFIRHRDSVTTTIVLPSNMASYKPMKCLPAPLMMLDVSLRRCQTLRDST